MRSTVTLLASVSLLAIACGSAIEPASETTAPTPTATPAAAGPDGTSMCVEMFTRQRECEAVYLPALVDLRVRLDVPEGIAAKDAANGREALLAGAREEWASDSTDDAIAATCDKIIASTPPSDLEALVPQAQACLAESDCEPFVSCSIDIHEAQMQGH